MFWELREEHGGGTVVWLVLSAAGQLKSFWPADCRLKLFECSSTAVIFSEWRILLCTTESVTSDDPILPLKIDELTVIGYTCCDVIQQQRCVKPVFIHLSYLGMKKLFIKVPKIAWGYGAMHYKVIEWCHSYSNGETHLEQKMSNVCIVIKPITNVLQWNCFLPSL